MKQSYPWYLVDLGVYLLLNIIFLVAVHPRFDLLRSVTPFGFVLLGLAVYRIANIISNETITQPIRSPFVRVKKTKHDVFEAPKSGALGAVGSLIYCPSCTGVWIATILVYAYILWPGIISILVVIFAASSLERIFTEGIGRLTK